MRKCMNELVNIWNDRILKNIKILEHKQEFKKEKRER